MLLPQNNNTTIIINIHNLYPDLILNKKMQLTYVIKNILASFSTLNIHFTYPNLRFKHQLNKSRIKNTTEIQKKIIHWQHKHVTLSADKLLKLWIPHNVSLNPFTPMLNWRLHVFLTKTLVKTSWDTRKMAQRHTLRNKLIFYLLTLSLQECLVEFCKMTLTFESVGEIL